MKRNYIKKTLKNGVKLYLYPDKNMKQYYVDYMIDYGSSGRWYDFYLDGKHHHVLPGCAHFLEHMLGEHSKYGNFYSYLESKKYFINAGTGLDITHYFFRGTEDVLESIKKLIHIVDDPVFTKKDVEETKHAIIEETKRVRNNKYRSLSCLIERNLYKDLELYTETLSTIGDEQTTKDISYEMLKICYDAFYYDENKTLLIAGPFDEKEMIDYIESIYSELKPHKKRLTEYEYPNLDKIRKKYDTIYKSTSDDMIGMCFKQINNNYTRNEIRYFLRFIEEMLFSESYDFKKKLKEENILVNYDGFYRFFLDDKHYYFAFQATVKDTEEFEKKLVKELKNITFAEKDFILFIRSSIGSEALKIDNKYQVFNGFSFSKEYNDNFDDIAFLKKLKFEDFLEFYKTLNFDDYVVGIVSDIGKSL